MKTIKALLVAPVLAPIPISIENTLENLQSIVGGSIQAVYPFDDPVAIICNEEGKLLNLQPNRPLYGDATTKMPVDILAGTFLVVGLGAEDFASLSDELIEKYKSMYEKVWYFTI